MTDINLQELTDEELNALHTDAAAEIDRRYRVKVARETAEKAAHDYAEAVAGQPPREWAPGMVIGPGEKVEEDGKVYINHSGAWLPVSPSQYSMGYHLETPPDGDEVAEWQPNEVVKVGDLRSFDNIVYKVIQAHTTQTGWEPPNVQALWGVA